MFNNRQLTYLLGVGFAIGSFTSCYQKKAPKNNRVVVSQEDEFPDDTLISGIHPDSIAYIDTFELLPTKTIFQHIQKNSRKKVLYKLPVLKSNDSLQNFEYIEQIAVTNVYASVGKLSNNTKLFAASLSENEELFSKILEDSVTFPKKPTLDSLNNWTEYAVTEYSGQNEWVYYEAIQWLENLYLTIENPKNSTNQKKLEELVLLQMENGTEMLERLSAYQDYPPIAVFSEFLIDILDCKYFTFDVTQLKKEVIQARENIYISRDTATNK